MSVTHPTSLLTPSPFVGRPGAGLRVECLTTTADVDGLASEWQALFDRVDDALPFAAYEWTAAWWRHMRARSWRRRDDLRVFTVRDGGTLVAVAPMMLTTWRVGVPVARVLQFIGTDPNITEVRGMLVAREHEAEVVDALDAHVGSMRGFTWVRWCGLRSPGDAPARLRSLKHKAVNKELTTFLLDLPGTWDEFRKALPRNIRESLRKCYNSIARDGHEWSLRVAETPADVASAIERLIDLHGRRAARDDTVQHRDCFGRPNARAFLADVAVRLAGRGMVRVFQIEIAGEVVAARLGFLFGPRLYLYYSGYDPAWGRYSVMTTAVAEALQYATRHGISSVNLSTGADESKLRWRPRPVGYVDVVTLRSTTLARLLLTR